MDEEIRSVERKDIPSISETCWICGSAMMEDKDEKGFIEFFSCLECDALITVYDGE